MPALTAHFKLSELAFKALDEEITSLIEKNIFMYNLGSQGPDLLFYYKPSKRNFANIEGSRYHNMSGGELFLPLLGSRDEWSQDLTAYLLGVCCHYALDRHVHPFVNEVAPTTVTHQSLEAEFDLHIINEYSMSRDRYAVIPDEKLNFEEIHRVYPKVAPHMLACAAKSFRKDFKLLKYKNLAWLVERLVGMKGVFTSLCLPKKVTSHKSMEEMHDRFLRAVTDAVQSMNVLLYDSPEQVLAHMHNNFKGETP